MEGIKTLHARLLAERPETPPGTVERVVLLRAFKPSLDALPAARVSEPVQRLICEEVRYLINPPPAVARRYDVQRNSLVGFCKLATLRRFPAGQLTWEISGVQRSWLLFLDDNPVERAWIREQLPEVAVVELGPSPSTYVRDLDAERLFEVLAVSSEDQQRADLYRREHERQELKSRASSLEEFLADLEMEADVEPLTPANLARATQLVNKTNQFNLTTRRYTEAQLSALAATPGAWTGVFRLKDRFGDHGIVGLLLCIPRRGRDEWEIDTWLMSCRVLGRELEKFMLDAAVSAARSAGISKIVGVYRPTAKNAVVADLYERLRFTVCQGQADERRYELPVSSANTPSCRVIRSAANPEKETAAR